MSVIDAVIKQLQLRGQGTAIRAFAKQQELQVPRSNLELKARLQSSLTAGRITDDALLSFFFEALLDFVWVRQSPA